MKSLHRIWLALSDALKRLSVRMSIAFSAWRERRRRHSEYKRLRRVRKYSIPAYRYCPNCGEELHGMYCSACGQYALDVKQSFGKMLKSYLVEAFQFDGKIAQTLKYLCFRPAFLSSEFMAGKIKSYVHPVRLYLFLSMFLFGFVMLVTGTQNRTTDSRYGVDVAVDSLADVDENQVLSRKDSAVLQLISGQLAKIDRSALDSTQLASVDLLEKSLAGEDRDAEDSLSEVPDDESLRLTEREQQVMKKELISLINKYMPFFILLMMPFYALLLKHSNRKLMLRYIDSFIFSVHLHSFAIVLLMLGITVNTITDLKPGWVLLLIFVWYHVVAVHSFYNRSWWSSIFKSLWCLLRYLFVIAFFGLVFFLILVYMFNRSYGFDLFD